jgi:hypothetical protein
MGWVAVNCGSLVRSDKMSLLSAKHQTGSGAHSTCYSMDTPRRSLGVRRLEREGDRPPPRSTKLNFPFLYMPSLCALERLYMRVGIHTHTLTHSLTHTLTHTWTQTHRLTDTHTHTGIFQSTALPSGECSAGHVEEEKSHKLYVVGRFDSVSELRVSLLWHSVKNVSSTNL